MFSFGPVFTFPVWLQAISMLAMVGGFQIAAYALLHTRWGSIPALQASLFAALIGVLLSGFLFTGLSL